MLNYMLAKRRRLIGKCESFEVLVFGHRAGISAAKTHFSAVKCRFSAVLQRELRTLNLRFDISELLPAAVFPKPSSSAAEIPDCLSPAVEILLFVSVEIPCADANMYPPVVFRDNASQMLASGGSNYSQ